VRTPGDKCEECGKELKPGDSVTFTDDMRRFWHDACFEASVRPLTPERLREWAAKR
jgi:hypothetical protein